VSLCISAIRFYRVYKYFLVYIDSYLNIKLNKFNDSIAYYIQNLWEKGNGVRKIFPTDFIMTPSDKPEMHGAVFTIWGGNRFTENNQTRFRRCRDTCRLVLIAIPDKPCIKCCCNNERLNKCRFGSCDMSRIIKFCLPLSIERERKREREREVTPRVQYMPGS